MELFKLYGRILVDSDEANKSIKKTGDAADKLGNGFKDGMMKAAKWSAGIIAAATAVGAALVGMAENTASKLDTLDKTAQRMGLPVEEFQAMGYAASQCGVEINDLEGAAKKLSQKGINLNDAINSLTKVQSESQKTRKAIELLGDDYYNLKPLIDMNSESYVDLKQKAYETGNVISEQSVSTAVKFKDSWDTLKGQFSALGSEIMSGFLPYLQELADWATKNIPIIKGVLEGIADVVKGIFTYIGTGMTSLIQAIGHTVEGISKLLSLDFSSAMEFFSAANDWSQNFMKGTGASALIQSLNPFSSGTVSREGNTLLTDVLGAYTNVKVTKAAYSHASGLNTVPYDGYQATLHRGEAVLNAQNASALLSDLQRNQSSQGSQTIVIPVNLDGNQIAKIVYKPLMEISGNAGAALAR